MDLATIIGIFTGFGLVGYSIVSGVGLGSIVDIPSLLIVIGGTIGAILINYSFKDVLAAGRDAKNALFSNMRDPREIINQIIGYAYSARRDGILVLEEAVTDKDNWFLKKGIRLAVDGEDVQSIQSILNKDIEWLKNRNSLGAEIFQAMGRFTPIIGLIGTLVGLVGMLQKMKHFSDIGPSMSVALIATFYGVILANLLFNPIAGKLKARGLEEVLLWELTREGVLAISAGDNPRIMERRLNSYLAPKIRGNEKD